MLEEMHFSFHRHALECPPILNLYIKWHMPHFFQKNIKITGIKAFIYPINEQIEGTYARNLRQHAF